MKILYRTKQLILLLGDLGSFIFAFWVSFLIRNFNAPTPEILTEHAVLFGILFLIWIIINYINGLYDLAYLKNRHWYRRVGEAGLMSLVISVILLYLHPQRDITPKTLLALNIAIGYTLSIVWRFAYHAFIGYRRLRTSVLIVGYSPEIEEIISIISKHPEKGYVVSAICDSEQKINKEALDKGTEVYTSFSCIRPAISKHKAEIIITAPHLMKNPMVLRELYELLFWPVRMIDYYTLYETLTNRVSPNAFSEDWFLSNLSSFEPPIYNKFRRLINYISAVLLGIIFVVALPITALAIKLNSRGPVFFKQTRVGELGQIFWMYKFRTMYALSKDGSAEQAGAEFARKGDKRITAVGKILRKLRIDELPQVINLIKGDLTLIGPRPERPEIVKKLEEKMPYYPLRHIVKPGITGWAAIQQHYTEDLETALEKLQYDLFYIKNRSVVLDVTILLRTVNVVMRMMGQ